MADDKAKEAARKGAAMDIAKKVAGARELQRGIAGSMNNDAQLAYSGMLSMRGMNKDGTDDLKALDDKGNQAKWVDATYKGIVQRRMGGVAPGFKGGNSAAQIGGELTFTGLSQSTLRQLSGRGSRLSVDNLAETIQGNATNYLRGAQENLDNILSGFKPADYGFKNADEAVAYGDWLAAGAKSGYKQ